MQKYLEIKLNSLAAEGALIKRAERRTKLNHAKWKSRGAKAAATQSRLAREERVAGMEPEKLTHYEPKVSTDRAGTPLPDVFFGLRNHRLEIVRPEARASHLALGFLRGHDYVVMEGPTTRSSPNWKRVEDLIKRFGEGDERDRMQKFSAWKDAATA